MYRHLPSYITTPLNGVYAADSWSSQPWQRSVLLCTADCAQSCWNIKIKIMYQVLVFKNSAMCSIAFIEFCHITSKTTVDGVFTWLLGPVHTPSVPYFGWKKHILADNKKERGKKRRKTKWCTLETPFSSLIAGRVVGSLQIRHSQESDEGKYECVAENSVGVAYSYAANLYVRGRCSLF